MPDLPLPKPTVPTAAPPPSSILSAKPQVATPTTSPTPITNTGGKPADAFVAKPTAVTPDPIRQTPPQSAPAISTPVSNSVSTPVTTPAPMPTPMNPAPANLDDDVLPPPSSLKTEPTPKGLTEMKPPAVVTALASVSSNQLPKTKDEITITGNDAVPVRAQAPTLTHLSGSTQPGLGYTAGNIPTPPSPNMMPSSPPGVIGGSTPPQTNTPVTPKQLAQTKKSPLRFLPIILGGLVLLIVIIFGATRLLGGQKTTSVDQNGTTPPPGTTTDETGGTGAGGNSNQEPVTLEYWGLWEPNQVMDGILKNFETQNPGITVQYVSQSYRDYRERLQTAIASKTGPDVFRFHATWAPMLSRELAPLPTNVLTATDFESIFYSVARNQLTINNSIVGLPVMYDGLLLYYNKDIFETAGIQPPKTWQELRTAALTLTIREGDQVKRAGVAMGTATNVEHFSDILGLLMMQNGATLETPNSPEGRDALLFYTNFTTQDKVWNDSLPSSTVAFARGDVAMMLAPSWRAFEIQSINPNLKFATTTTPQLANERMTWASYWAEGVNAMSTKQEAAWKLLHYLSSNATQKQLYAAQAQVRSFGEPYARKDLADELAIQPLVAPLLQDAPYARGWYMSSYTHDNGLNDQIIKYYSDAVNAVGASKNIQEVLNTLSLGVQQVLTQYNLTAPTSQSAI